MKLPLLVLVGPTAIGKTAISVALAKQIGAEIISGDSMQVYRGMDIGTAKITHEEMQGVPHHLIDIKAPDEPFSVAEFQERVDRLILEISGRGQVPMLVGGTGLYVRSIVQEYTFTEMEADPALRSALAKEEEENGPGYLHRRLMVADPALAAKLHPNDLRRIIRALEVFTLTGHPLSSTQHASFAAPRYDDLMIGLSMERSLLYQRIDERVEEMLARGLQVEVQALLRRFSPHLSPLQAIGYREMLLYLRGILTWGEMVHLIKRNTRRFAKRQCTWFRRESGIHWIDLTEMTKNEALWNITKRLQGKWGQDVEAPMGMNKEP